MLSLLLLFRAKHICPYLNFKVRIRVRLKIRVRLGVKVRSETGLELRRVGVGLEWYLDLGCASIYQYSGGVGRISFRI